MLTRLIARVGLCFAVLVPFAAVAAEFDHSHAAWTALLRKHVVLIDGGNASQLRYAAIAPSSNPS